MTLLLCLQTYPIMHIIILFALLNGRMEVSATNLSTVLPLRESTIITKNYSAPKLILLPTPSVSKVISINLTEAKHTISNYVELSSESRHFSRINRINSILHVNNSILIPTSPKTSVTLTLPKFSVTPNLSKTSVMFTHTSVIVKLADTSSVNKTSVIKLLSVSSLNAIARSTAASDKQSLNTSSLMMQLHTIPSIVRQPSPTKAIVLNPTTVISSVQTSNNTDPNMSTTTIEITKTTTMTTPGTSMTSTTSPPPTTTTAVSPTTPKPKRILRILTFTRADYQHPRLLDRWYLKSCVHVAAKMINDDPNLLVDYKLELYDITVVHFHGNIELDIAAKIFLKDPHYFGILGPGNSLSLDYFNNGLLNYAILQMNYRATELDFSEASKHKNLFSLHPTAQSHNNAIVNLLKSRRWRRVAIVLGIALHDPSESLIEFKTAHNLADMLRKENIEYELVSFRHGLLAYRNSETSDMKSTLKYLKEKDYRIFVGTWIPEAQSLFMCQVSLFGLVGPKYYWMLANHISSRQWHHDEFTGCPGKEHLRNASRSMLYTFSEYARTDGMVTVANKTVAEIEKLLKEYRQTTDGSAPNPVEGRSLYAFDSVWALALALDKAVKNIPDFVNRYSIYKDDSVFQQFKQYMWNTKFQGATGPVKFDYGRGRLINILFQQYGGGSFVTIGRYNSINNTISIDDELETSITGYPIPKDGFRIQQYPIEFSDITLIIIWTFAIMATILSLWFMFTNIKYRGRTYIKMSSPNINNAVVVGCTLCYLAIVLYGLDSKLIDKERIPCICDVIVVCLMYGFTLAFGALFSKTWRIYRIFTSARYLKTIVIRDIHLFGVIFLMMLVDTFIIVLWMIVSPYELGIEKIASFEDAQADVITEEVLYRCECQYMTYFGVVIFVYKGLLLIVGLFLAWETRNINVAIINDSKQIGVAVYTTAVLASVGSICSFSLYHTTNYMQSYVVFAICILLCTTTTLCLVFVPKIKMMVDKFVDPNFRNGRPILSEESITSHRMHSSSFYNKSEGSASDYYNTIQRKNTVDSDLSEFTDTMDGTTPRRQISLNSNGHNGDVVISNGSVIANKSFHSQKLENGQSRGHSSSSSTSSTTLPTRHPFTKHEFSNVNELRQNGKSVRVSSDSNAVIISNKHVTSEENP